MPELPEVETVRAGLAPVMTGRYIQNVQVNRYDLRFPMPEDFVERVQGQKILHTGRRGKFILIALSNGQSIIMHLGMSGQVKIVAEGDIYKEAKHDHLIFELGSGAKIVFHDPRRFGSVLLHDTETIEHHRFFELMGPEPLSNHFHEDYLYKALMGKQSPIKLALLDQHVVAGLGNIYVSEALFMAGIHPKTKAGKISKKRLGPLCRAIVEVLNKAIEAGGSTLKDYKKADGSLGYFQHSFSVYDRANQPCKTCDGSITKIVQSGRSTYYCKACQK